MELTEAQRAAVSQWVDEGCGLSEIQRRLRTEYNLAMTYMDVRFLVIDLGLTLKEDDRTARERAAPTDTAPPDLGALDGAAAGQESPGGVQVSLDRVVKPGAVVSGTVSFSDGTRASWMLDQLGRLALDAGDPSYRPSQEDLAAFQSALQDTLHKQGY